MNAKLDQRGTTPLVHCAFTEAELRTLMAALNVAAHCTNTTGALEMLRNDVRCALHALEPTPQEGMYT